MKQNEKVHFSTYFLKLLGKEHLYQMQIRYTLALDGKECKENETICNNVNIE